MNLSRFGISLYSPCVGAKRGLLERVGIHSWILKVDSDNKSVDED
jgi:hypothetical protein